MNRNQFKRIAQTRLEDARALLAKKRYSAAYYLAGYSVECALKACIARQTKRYDFPPHHRIVQDNYWTHDLQKLLGQSGLSDLFHKEMDDQELWNNWNVAKGWSESARYEVQSPKVAKGLLDAISDPQHGVLEYIKRYW